jgi:glycosyltransferase involved in cell wall biosynthesis
VKILYITTNLSHHELPVALEIAKLIGAENFCYAAMFPLHPGRSKMGWKSPDEPCWVIKPYKSRIESEKMKVFEKNADIIICNQRLMHLFLSRIKRKKHTFYMSERWFRPPFGKYRMLSPKFLWLIFQLRKVSQSSYFHYLSIGQDAGRDLRCIAKFKNPIRNWGYFTSVLSNKCFCHNMNSEFTALWAGRMLKLKQVDCLIGAVKSLLAEGISLKLLLVGSGNQKSKLMGLVSKNNLSENIKFLEPMSTNDLRKLMNRVNVYVLPSNASEGWGAVVNEAMSEGLPVIVCKDAGSAKSLIRNCENGFLFESGNVTQLTSILKLLIEDDKLRLAVAEKGLDTITNLWSPQKAALRVVTLCDSLMNNSSHPVYKDGPCSICSNN